MKIRGGDFRLSSYHKEDTVATEYNHTNRIDCVCPTEVITISMARYEYLTALEERVKTVCALLDKPVGEHFNRFDIIDSIMGGKE